MLAACARRLEFGGGFASGTTFSADSDSAFADTCTRRRRFTAFLLPPPQPPRPAAAAGARGGKLVLDSLHHHFVRVRRQGVGKHVVVSSEP
eukprot:835192-Prymnesium_polylepis.1